MSQYKNIPPEQTLILLSRKLDQMNNASTRQETFRGLQKSPIKRLNIEDLNKKQRENVVKAETHLLKQIRRNANNFVIQYQTRRLLAIKKQSFGSRAIGKRYKQPIVSLNQDEQTQQRMPSRPQIAFGVRITNSPLKIIMNKDLMSKEQSPRQDFKEQEESKQIELFNSSFQKTGERWRKSSPRRKRPLLIHTKSSNQTGDDSPLMMSPLKFKKKSYNETKSPQRSVTKRQKNFYESVQTSMIIEDDDFLEIKKQDIVLIEEEKTITYKRRGTNFNNEIIDDETVKYNPYYGRSRESLMEESDLTLPQQRILATQNSLLSTDKLSCMIIKTNHLDQIQYYPENETRIIYYKDSRILHHSILKDFSDEMDKDLIVKRATMNQVLVESSEKFPKPFESPSEIENFLKKFSKAYQSVFSIQQIGRGGESVVYRLQTQELDEIVAKCPILKMKENFSSQESLNFFQSTLYENQLLKVKAHSDFTAKIKEEVIEYNKDLGLIIRYSMKAIDYLHSKNIYYGDMKPENLLIFRNQQVKIGDFGISIKLYKNHKNSKNYPNFYKIRGYTRQYSLPYIQKPLCLVSKPDLYLNDRFGLWKTFHDIYHLMKLKKLSNGSELLEMMISDLDFKKSKLKLHEITLKYIKYFTFQNDFALQLSSKLLLENKSLAVREILRITTYGQNI
eukprot:403337218